MSRYTIGGAWQRIKEAVKPTLSDAYSPEYCAKIPDEKPISEEDRSRFVGPCNAHNQLNGGTLQISLNLGSALLNWRWMDEPTILWVNAVCINQQDYDEKPGQVNMMGPIYRNTSRCVVWLGNAHVSRPDDVPQKDTKKGFALLMILRDEAVEMKRMGKESRAAQRRPVQEAEGRHGH
ncbi:heterokaryon incompatibility protein-domain-containing protein [Triangularia setosa]|uniref:Heterokaryon incompatibility protein-domain-containing protein n=1 Tax=Triangularia setosa TaxID=2587417 RepID=A0AAN6W1J0_9PEZI|nr:heterokaryon incompatibility protein-domain-containing protein [Podospora setosa]